MNILIGRGCEKLDYVTCCGNATERMRLRAADIDFASRHVTFSI